MELSNFAMQTQKVVPHTQDQVEASYQRNVGMLELQNLNPASQAADARVQVCTNCCGFFPALALGRQLPSARWM